MKTFILGFITAAAAAASLAVVVPTPATLVAGFTGLGIMFAKGRALTA